MPPALDKRLQNPPKDQQTPRTRKVNRPSQKSPCQEADGAKEGELQAWGLHTLGSACEAWELPWSGFLQRPRCHLPFPSPQPAATHHLVPLKLPLDVPSSCLTYLHLPQGRAPALLASVPADVPSRRCSAPVCSVKLVLLSREMRHVRAP